MGTVFSAAAAGAALFAVRRANNTADSVARIERDRWHTDLAPHSPADRSSRNACRELPGPATPRSSIMAVAVEDARHGEEITEGVRGARALPVRLS
ncbi:hypothetical protein [Streptomyces sp. NPDC048385]|uniref:hypothetical protein n=1 Tax=unclassified Streptomyces TaxID=2593676 RepID=UPI00341AA6DD